MTVSIRKFGIIVLVSNRILSNYLIRFEILNIHTALHFIHFLIYHATKVTKMPNSSSINNSLTARCWKCFLIGRNPLRFFSRTKDIDAAWTASSRWAGLNTTDLFIFEYKFISGGSKSPSRILVYINGFRLSAMLSFDSRPFSTACHKQQIKLAIYDDKYNNNNKKNSKCSESTDLCRTPV